jgi:hypothetical protein
MTRGGYLPVEALVGGDLWKRRLVAADSRQILGFICGVDSVLLDAVRE